MSEDPRWTDTHYGRQSLLELRKILREVIRIARQAGEVLLQYHTTLPMHTRRKNDGTPVTDADYVAEELITSHLEKLTPGIPIIAEESYQNTQPLQTNTHYFWLVDPLDGTYNFIQRQAEFTVNIGLVENHRPILGVMNVPVQKHLYTGIIGDRATLIDSKDKEERIQVTQTCQGKYRVLLSRLERIYVNKHNIHQRFPCMTFDYMSSALKMCTIARGQADIYPRLASSREWDTAAGQVIIEAAHGIVEDVYRKPLTYGKVDFLNTGFLAYGRSALHLPDTQRNPLLSEFF